MGDDIEFISKYENLKILIAPLNWGLGHASRCVPIIQRLSKSNQVHIASDGVALSWLKSEFPDLAHSELPSYDISYTGAKAWLSVLRSGQNILKAISKERKRTQDLVDKHGFDLIISDHRHGVCSSAIESIIIAHQLSIPNQNPIISSIASKIQARYINRFDVCWIPDISPTDELSKPTLSGDLSQSSLKIPKIYIGPLSRFVKCRDQHIMYDIAIVLSGPEPARTSFERKLISALTDDSMMNFKIVFVRGTNDSLAYANLLPGNISFLNLINSDELNQLICKSRVVIARSGYSTIMDLNKLQKKAVLIPTPGQPEQEYLAGLHHQNNSVISLQESDVTPDSLQKALKTLL